MTDSITEIGVGVVIAILLIREVFPFMLKATNGRNGKGATPITRDEFDKHKGVVQYKDNCAEIVKRMDSAMSGLRDGQKENRDAINKHFGEVKDLIRGLQ